MVDIPHELLPFQEFPRSTKAVFDQFDIADYRYTDGKHHITFTREGKGGVVSDASLVNIARWMDLTYSLHMIGIADPWSGLHRSLIL